MFVCRYNILKRERERERERKISHKKAMTATTDPF